MTDIHTKAVEAAADVLTDALEELDEPIGREWEREVARLMAAAYEAALWRPISEAPVGGSSDLFLVAAGSEMWIAIFDGAVWLEVEGKLRTLNPTHFRPLPPAPEGK